MHRLLYSTVRRCPRGRPESAVLAPPAPSWWWRLPAAGGARALSLCRTRPAACLLTLFFPFFFFFSSPSCHLPFIFSLVYVFFVVSTLAGNFGAFVFARAASVSSLLLHPFLLLTPALLSHLLDASPQKPTPHTTTRPVSELWNEPLPNEQFLAPTAAAILLVSVASPLDSQWKQLTNRLLHPESTLIARW